jgi:tRNA U34 2-thiouridine synthase MnmA/TrmU
MKALCVFSGGLDSLLAAELIRSQGINVLGIFFETPFFTSKQAELSAKSIDLPFKVVDIAQPHLQIVKHPKHGYGGNMNPCLDCHTLMFKITGEMLAHEKAGFVVTGEVLGQRPMSQNKAAMDLIAKESHLNRLLLRPLSAKRLPVSIPEEKGWVDRGLLMGFQGRSRKSHMELAQALGIKEYPAPAGGCLLTEKFFAKRLRDLLTSKKNPEIREIELLKVGRHFRVSPDTKIVVGRNEKENIKISAYSSDSDLVLMTVAVPGPTVLAIGNHSNDFIRLAASMTAAYSDASENEFLDIRVMQDKKESIIKTMAVKKEDFRHCLV